MPQGGLPDQDDGERGTTVHVVVGEQPDRFELMIVEQVGLIDDEHGVSAAFGVFGGQCAEYCGGPHALMRYAVERTVTVNIAATGGDPALFDI